MRPERARKTVVIVGGGFSGTMTAIQLARLAGAAGPRIVLIERTDWLARGVAYGTECPQHLLNVPAANMSAYPDQPNHFVAWGQERGLGILPDAFVQRAWYGQYLLDELRSVVQQGLVETVRGWAVDVIEAAGVQSVQLGDGRSYAADHVVLALGNYPPRDPAVADEGFVSSRQYIRNPWHPSALTDIAGDDRVLVIGTGLTMVDTVLQLHARGHRGVIHAISRHGLLPQSHREKVIAPTLRELPKSLFRQRTALGLLRAVRAAIRAAEDAGANWRDVMAALRPHTPALWTRLDTAERKRFLQHLRPYWEVHRHRIASKAAKAIDDLIREGRLVTHAGRLVACTAQAGGMRLRIQPREHAGERLLTGRWLINCTGPESDVRRIDDPLWRNLLRRRRVQVDACGLGLLTDEAGALLDTAGAVPTSLQLIGSLGKPKLWENTAVPELRVQAATLANRLWCELVSSPPGSTGGCQSNDELSATNDNAPRGRGAIHD